MRKAADKAQLQDSSHMSSKAMEVGDSYGQEEHGDGDDDG